MDTSTFFYLKEFTDAAKDSSAILQLFFIVIGLIALILSFFLIWTTFYSNIRDNICEFGIMRYNIFNSLFNYNIIII